MRLSIERFATRCRVPQQVNGDRALMERVARGRFASECASQLRSRMASHAGVVRIRRLRVQLRVGPAQLQEETLACLWAAAFVRELLRALSYPSGAGPVEIVRSGSGAEYLAGLIRDLIAGVASQRWEYEEFRELFGLHTSDAVVVVLRQEPTQIIPILLTLEDWGWLNRVAACFTESHWEELFAAMESKESSEQILSIDDIVTVGQLMLEHAPPVSLSRMKSRGLALEFFLAALRGQAGTEARTISLRRVFVALHALAALLDEKDSTARESSRLRALRAVRTTDGPDDIAWKLTPNIDRPIENASNANKAKLAQLVSEISATMGLKNSPASEVISSQCAGLFLLIGILERLEWPERIARSSLGAAYGSRAITYTLAGLGLAILNRFTETPNRVDPGLALFSGWINDPHLGGFCRFLISESSHARRELLASLCGQGEFDKWSESWEVAFDYLADNVIREFAVRIRGFGKASRSFLVKNFLSLPGRIRIEDTKLVVSLPPNPFNVVLHLSGMDDPVEAVSWLGGRRLELQLDGL